MFSLIIAEAAFETVPKAITKHASVANHAYIKSKSAHDILLDRSYHHAAMLTLNDAGKRGRPDLLHFTLLAATSTPLYQKGLMEIYVHTIVDKVIFLHGNIKLPKSYFRFEGVMETLFKDRRIKSNLELLMEVRDMQFTDLINIIKPKNIIGLSRSGVKSSVEQVARCLDEKTALVIGGFAHGHFSPKLASKLDGLFSVSECSLEAHVVTARVLYPFLWTGFWG